MPGARGEEARGGGVEDELQAVARLGAHLQALALIVDGQHGARFEGASEMRDARAGADARERL